MRSLPCLLLLVAVGPCRAEGCDQLPLPSVSIKRLDERLLQNNTYGYRSLTTIGASAARPGQQVLGLTRGNASARFSISVPTLLDPTQRWECFSPQITLTYGFSPLTVYVAREFPEGSCGHQEIQAHEMRHVKTYQAHLTAIEKELAATLNQRFATGAPWRGPAGESAARLQQELDERWLPYVQREIRRVEEAQALIDTPEEYERITKACNGEISQRIR